MNGKIFPDDDFWNLSKLVPKEPESEHMSANVNTEKRKAQPNLAPMIDSYRAKSQNNVYASSPLTSLEEDTEFIEYAPESKPFVLSVRLSPSNAKSAHDFETSAKKYKQLRGTEVPFCDFYSFTPLYRNLSREAFAYYLWWRTSFLEGKIIRTTWSYISLYLSELVNSEDGDPWENVSHMWNLFSAYADPTKETYVTDALIKLPEVICDYSLIHRLSIPASVSEKDVCLAAENARFREAFFDSAHPAGLTVLLTRLCSDYDYEKSKFASQVRLQNAMNYIYGAVKYSADKARLEKVDHPLAGVYREKTTITRYSYANHIFVLPKYTFVIKVDFCSANRSYLLRNTVTGIVKHCENRFRAHSGIRSKLRVFSLEPFFRDAVDEYLNSSLPAVRHITKERKAAEPEYEKLYELPKTEFSLDKAKQIEQRSWDVTERLVESIDDYKPIEIIPSSDESKSPEYRPISSNENPQEALEQISSVSDGEISAILALCPECKDFLIALYQKNYRILMNESDKLGIPPSVVVDRINSAAFDVIGDTLIEEGDLGTFEIIPDYLYLFENL